MIGIYAIGGGAGHVTRARRVIEVLGIEAMILATPADRRAAGDVPLIEIPCALDGDVNAHRSWLRAQPFERLLIDTFPCGIQGEVSGLDIPLDFIGRLLRVEEYRKAMHNAPWPRFETAYVVEEGAPEVQAQRIMRLELGLDPSNPSRSKASDGAQATKGDYWLIVHSGPAEEVGELVEYARELRNGQTVLVATPLDISMPEGFRRIDAFPAAPLFAGAGRIISAAGFNVMLETEPWREKHLVVPFPRRFDDQFARAARRRRDVRIDARP